MAVAGFYCSDPATPFEAALGAATLPEAQDVDSRTFLPSSRSVAFRKVAWERAGGYPEWIDYCEDVIFDLSMRRNVAPFVFVPEALVHFRPRQSLRAFARQYYLYARGDGKANLFPAVHAIRYGAYLVVAPLLFYAALKVGPWLWLLAVMAGLAYLRRPLRRALKNLRARPPLEVLQVLLYLPIIRLVGDLAKMAGYPAGWIWRLRSGINRGSGGPPAAARR
jgi:hypothetical protein